MGSTPGCFSRTVFLAAIVQTIAGCANPAVRTQSGAALAAAQSKGAQLKEVSTQSTACIAEIRNRPEYAPLQPYFPNPETSNFTPTQLADGRIPTSGESHLMAAYLDESNSCRDKAITDATRIAPTVGSVMRQWNDTGLATWRLLIQRKLTWGEATQQLKRVSDEANAKLRVIRL
jgi:hypothetical protein